MTNNNYDIRTELACFKIIWTIPPMNSYLSGVSLRNYFNSNLAYSCCAHVLSKAQNKYPHFRLYLKNIKLVFPEEHRIIDFGTKEQKEKYSKRIQEEYGKDIVDWGKWKSLEKELIEEYNKYFPSKKGLIIGYKYAPDEVNEIIKKLNSDLKTELEEEYKKHFREPPRF